MSTNIAALSTLMDISQSDDYGQLDAKYQPMVEKIQHYRKLEMARAERDVIINLFGNLCEDKGYPLIEFARPVSYEYKFEKRGFFSPEKQIRYFRHQTEGNNRDKRGQLSTFNNGYFCKKGKFTLYKINEYPCDIPLSILKQITPELVEKANILSETQKPSFRYENRGIVRHVDPFLVVKIDKLTDYILHDHGEEYIAKNIMEFEKMLSMNCSCYYGYELNRYIALCKW